MHKGWFWITGAALVAVVGWSLTMPETVAIEALEKQGFTNVEIVARYPMVIASFMGCGEDDIVAFKATAVNSQGQEVTDVTACVGLFKGVTTRF